MERRERVKSIQRVGGSLLMNFLMLSFVPFVASRWGIDGFEPVYFYVMAVVYGVAYSISIWFVLYRKNLEYYLFDSYRTHIKVFTFTLLVLPIVSAFFVPAASRMGYFSFDDVQAHVVHFLLFLSQSVLIFFLKRLWIHYLCEIGYFRKNVLFVTSKPNVDDSISHAIQNLGYTKNVRGTVKPVGEEWQFADINGTEMKPNLLDIIYTKEIGELVLVDENPKLDALLSTVSEQLKVSFFRVRRGRKGRLIVHNGFSTNRDSLFAISLKRLFDVFGALLGLLVFSPIILIAMILIKIEDGGPILYVSKRVGKDGKHIDFYKFRTMVVDAERKKKELLKFNVRKDGPLFKMPNDPRVTRIGKFLRKFSVDEVPQFINVLIGNMSIVGPRPHLPSEVEEYSDIDYFRLECMPGITCIPQVRGRNTLTFREWIDLDLEYRADWTVWLDLALILQTVLIVLKPFFARSGGGH
jgi:lipopolysaccharide/colanic/teichoic acid biosynthesis glycosyltransferase